MSLQLASLFEFRYFIVPFLFVGLHARDGNTNGQLSQLLFNATLNVFTLYMFLYRPYIWPNGEIARIMW